MVIVKIFIKNLRTNSNAVLKGFNGYRCENNIDDCIGIICPPKKVCVDLVANYECRCPIGYSGEDCSKEVDPCSKNPCSNGGTCSVNTMTHDFSCSCATGYTGNNKLLFFF